MYRPIIALTLCLSACTQPTSQTTRAADNLRVPEPSCQMSSQPICAFFNAPLTLLTTPINLLLRKATFYPMARDLQFVDSEKKTWVAPKGTLTDGASIPPVFVAMVGSPTSKEFVNAAAVHDAYCGVGNAELIQYHSETWQDVHRMFYDALRVGGTSPRKAKTMFAAVYLGGPRWEPPRLTSNKSQRAKTTGGLFNQQARSKSTDEPQRTIDGQSLRLQGMSNQRLQRELQAAIEFIDANRPTIAELERFLIGRERIWRDTHRPQRPHADDTGPTPAPTPPTPPSPTPPSPTTLAMGPAPGHRDLSKP